MLVLVHYWLYRNASNLSNCAQGLNEEMALEVFCHHRLLRGSSYVSSKLRSDIETLHNIKAMKERRKQAIEAHASCLGAGDRSSSLPNRTQCIPITLWIHETMELIDGGLALVTERNFSQFLYLAFRNFWMMSSLPDTPLKRSVCLFDCRIRMASSGS